MCVYDMHVESLIKKHGGKSLTSCNMPKSIDVLETLNDGITTNGVMDPIADHQRNVLASLDELRDGAGRTKVKSKIKVGIDGVRSPHGVRTDNELRREIVEIPGRFQEFQRDVHCVVSRYNVWIPGRQEICDKIVTTEVPVAVGSQANYRATFEEFQRVPPERFTRGSEHITGEYCGVPLDYITNLEVPNNFWTRDTNGNRGKILEEIRLGGKDVHIDIKRSWISRLLNGNTDKLVYVFESDDVTLDQSVQMESGGDRMQINYPLLNGSAANMCRLGTWANRSQLSVGDGEQLELEYSRNGDGYVQHGATRLGRELSGSLDGSRQVVSDLVIPTVRGVNGVTGLNAPRIFASSVYEAQKIGLVEHRKSGVDGDGNKVVGSVFIDVRPNGVGVVTPETDEDVAVTNLPHLVVDSTDANKKEPDIYVSDQSMLHPDQFSWNMSQLFGVQQRSLE